MDPDSIPVDSGCDSIPGIPVTVPAEFEFVAINNVDLVVLITT